MFQPGRSRTQRSFALGLLPNNKGHGFSGGFLFFVKGAKREYSQMEMSVEKFVSRRLHPVRVTVSLLHREMDAAKGDEVFLNRDLLESIVNTLEIFVGDYDVNFSASLGAKPGKEKKFVDVTKGTVKV